MQKFLLLTIVLFVSLTTAHGQIDSALTDIIKQEVLQEDKKLADATRIFMVINDYSEILQEYEKLADEMQENYNRKDFRQAELILRKMITLIEKINLSDDRFSAVRPIIDKLKANTYYNLACANSLLNQKKQAIDAFEKSIALGYNDYYHVLVDTDLNNIRNEERFVSLLRELSVKTYLEKQLSELKRLFEKSERWEYYTLRSSSSSIPVSDLDRLGKEGWELVSCNTEYSWSYDDRLVIDNYRFIFKRKLP